MMKVEQLRSRSERTRIQDRFQEERSHTGRIEGRGHGYAHHERISGSMSNVSRNRAFEMNGLSDKGVFSGRVEGCGYGYGNRDGSMESYADVLQNNIQDREKE